MGPSTKTPPVSFTGITGVSWTRGTSPALTRLGDNAGRAVGEAITQLYPWSQIK